MADAEHALGIEGNVSSKVCLFESICKGNMHRAFEQPRSDARRSSMDLDPAFPAPRVVEGRADVLQRSDNRCDPDTETLSIHRLPGEPLGFEIEPQADGQRWRVRAVEVGTPADRAGLRPGDDVTRINGVALAAESRSDVIGLLSALPLRVQLTVQRAPRAKEEELFEGEEEEAEEAGEEAVTRRKYHKKTQAHSAAGSTQLAPCARWKSGSSDSLWSAGGDSRRNSMTSIDTLLTGDRDYLTRALGLREVVVEVEKTKGEYMGVNVTNGGDAMVDYFQIKRIHEGGVIARCRQFHPGDYLFSLNDVNLMGISKHELVKVMQNAEGKVQITVLRKDEAPVRALSPSRPNTPNSCDLDQLFSGVEVSLRNGSSPNAMPRASSSSRASPRLHDNAVFAQSRVKLRMSSTSGPFGFNNESLHTTNIDDVRDDEEEEEEDEDIRERAESSTQTSPTRPVLRMEGPDLLSESQTEGSLRSRGTARQFSTLLRTEYELQNRARAALKVEPLPKPRKPSFLSKVIRQPSRHDSRHKIEQEPPVRDERERRESLTKLNAEIQAAEEWLRSCLDDVRSVKARSMSQGEVEAERDDNDVCDCSSVRSELPARPRHEDIISSQDRTARILFNSVFKTSRNKVPPGRTSAGEQTPTYGTPFEIQVCKGVLGLGVKLKVVHGRAIIQEIQRRGPLARLTNVRIGDCIVSVNGQSLVGLSESRVNNILRVQPRGLVTLVLCQPTSQDSRQPPDGTEDLPDSNGSVKKPRQNPMVQDRRTTCIRVNSFVRNIPKKASCDEVDDTVIQVTLHKNTILGFCIEGGLRAPGGDRPIRVKRFFKGPMGAQASRVLREGDEILSVNGLSFANLSHEEAWSYLRRMPSGAVEICVRRSDSVNKTSL